MEKQNRKLSAKLKRTGGFTLVEMLIVVAIIAILIAVSIPLVSQALEKARDATDQANERAAKAEAVMIYLGVTDLNAEADVDDGDLYQTLYSKGLGFVYNIETGKLNYKNGEKFSKGYGKCTGCDNENYPNCGDHSNLVIGVWVAADGQVTVGWVPYSTDGRSIRGLKSDGTINYS